MKITRRALVQRLQRRLAAKGMRLVAARGKFQLPRGSFYVVDLSMAEVVDSWGPESLRQRAAAYGVLRPEETEVVEE